MKTWFITVMNAVMEIPFPPESGTRFCNSTACFLFCFPILCVCVKDTDEKKFKGQYYSITLEFLMA